MRSPSRRASARRLSTTTPAPSARTKPSAAASNVLQRPAGDNMPKLENEIPHAGDKIKLTPPASARSDSLERRLWHAKWTASKDEEQAVSTTMLGPAKSRRYETLFATMEFALPVLAYASRLAS